MADILNVEIKAKCLDPSFIRDYLKNKDAYFKGIDHQIDTYFNIAEGRLKLREGNIENTLIFYKRNNQAGPKESFIKLYKLNENSTDLLKTLNAALGSKVVVDKKREIFFLENVKFHIDKVENLGNFVEIEAIDETGIIGKERLLEQCLYYMAEFGLNDDDLIENSYSDLLSEIIKNPDISP